MHGPAPLTDIACNQCGGTDARLVFVKAGYRLVRCTACDLAYIGNPPSAAALAHVYSADAGYHDELRGADDAAAARMAAVARDHLRFVRRAQVPTGRLLDVGASTGLFLNAAREAGFDVAGVEFNAASADYARATFGLDVATGTLAAAGHAPESFDVVTMFDVIEHVPDPSAEMRLVHSLLRPGGWFVLSTPDIDGLFPRLSLPLANLLDYWPHPEPPGHLFQFSKATLSAMLRANGFAPGRIGDTNMPLAYSFGTLHSFRKSPMLLAYAALFAPVAKLGPVIGMGDWFYIAARKV